MITGITFMGKSNLLTTTNINVLKYFTVDSNILIGLTSLIYLLSNKNSKLLGILKLSSTTSITITFLVTALYLAPFNNYPIIEFYKNSNLFFHLIIPILSIITYLFFDELNNIKKKDLLWNILPILLYSTYYTTNVLLHIENNKVSFEYDFYGFLKGGLNTIIIVIPIFFIFTYLIGLLLYKLRTKFT